MDWTTGARFPARIEIFPVRYRVQTNSGTHSASYPMNVWVLPPWREPDLSPPSSAEIKNAWGYSSSPPYVFMEWYLFKHTCNFTFTLIIIFREKICSYQVISPSI